MKAQNVASAAGASALILAVTAGAEAVFQVSLPVGSWGRSMRDPVLCGPDAHLFARACGSRGFAIVMKQKGQHKLTPRQPASVKAPFLEQFNQPIADSRWTVSRATKQTPVGDETFSYVGVWSVEEPEVYPGIKGDTGLVLSVSRSSEQQ